MFLILVAGSSGAAYYFYTKYQTAQAALDNPQASAKAEVKLLTDKVGKLISLPEDEEPTVATVLEKDKIKDQPFFSNAENGDKVIIYTKARKAIIYRPDTNMIIEVAPIEITQPTGETDEEPVADITPEPVVETTPEEVVEETD